MVEDLIRELKEDIEREKWHRLWQRYGSTLIGLAVVLVVATGAHSWWRQHQASQNAAAGGKFQAAFSESKENKLKEAVAHFAELRTEKAKGYATLSVLQEAATLEKLGKKTEALDIYKKLAQDQEADAYFRNLASITLASKLEAKEALPLLDTVIAGKGPLWSQALEIRAGKFVETENKDKAKADLQTLAKEAGVPEAARMRAARTLAQLETQP